jgi:hypothetical protein
MSDLIAVAYPNPAAATLAGGSLAEAAGRAEAPAGRAAAPLDLALAEAALSA